MAKRREAARAPESTRARLGRAEPGPVASPQPADARSEVTPALIWLTRLGWLIALAIGVAPLWAARDLPMVDLPQHLYIVAALNHLADARTLFPNYFALRPEWTPYAGYYEVVGVLARIVPLELANRLFLTAMVAGVPLGMAFLLRSLERPAWPALLSLPFAYGDSFAWGFVGYCASIPFAMLAMGTFVRALVQPRARLQWTVGFGLALLALLSFHPVLLLFLALALPLLAATTRTGEEREGTGTANGLRSRLVVFAGAVPALALTAAWFMGFSHFGRVAPGVPGAAWGAMFSPANLRFTPPGLSVAVFPWLLSNIMNDGTDRLGVFAVLAVGLAAVVARWCGSRQAWSRTRAEAMRPAGLALLAFALYLALPADIQGYVNYLNPRFSHFAAALAVGCVPGLGARSRAVFPWLAMAAALAVGLPLARGFAAFDREAQALRALVPATAERPTLMGVIPDPNSRVVHHPVFIHSAATLARLRGGIPDYTFAEGRQTPIWLRAPGPPRMLYGWRPESFDYATYGPWYDHFLLRGTTPAQVFGSHLGAEVQVVAHAGEFWLVRHVAPGAR